MRLKAKPSYNFQSVEFEVEIQCQKDYDNFLIWYRRIYKDLREIAPEEGAKQPKKAKAKEPLATEGQIQIMEKYGIEVPDGCTKKQASKLITESIERKKEDEVEALEDEDLPF